MIVKGQPGELQKMFAGHSLATSLIIWIRKGCHYLGATIWCHYPEDNKGQGNLCAAVYGGHRVRLSEWTISTHRGWQQHNLKVVQISEQTFLLRRHTHGQHYMKIGSKSLMIRAMEIRTTMRYHIIQFRVGTVKKYTNRKCWKGCGEKGTLLYYWCECKWVQPRWRRYGGSSSYMQNYHMSQQSHCRAYIQRRPLFEKILALQGSLQHCLQ